MSDMLLVVLTVAVFIVALLYVLACARLGEG